MINLDQAAQNAGIKPLQGTSGNDLDWMAEQAGIKPLASQSFQGQGGITGALSSASDWIGHKMDKVSNLPGIKQIGEVTGAAVGVPGYLVGGAVGGAGKFLQNVIQGKQSLTEGVGESAKRTAEATGNFGYDIGKQAPMAGLQSTLGRVPNAILGANQIYQGGKTAYEGYKTGDVDKEIEGGSNLALGTLGLLGGVKEKGNFVNEGVTKPVSELVRAKMGGTTMENIRAQDQAALAKASRAKAEAAISKALPAMEDVLQNNASKAKKEQRSALIESRTGKTSQDRKTPARILLEEGIIPGTREEYGRTVFDTTKNIQELDAKHNQAEDLFQRELAKDPQPKFDLEKLKQESLAKVDDNKTIAATEKKAMKAEVEQHFNDEIEARGRMVNGENLNQVKRAFYKVGDYKNLSPGQKHIRQSAEILKSAIEDGYKDQFDVKKVNEVLGDYVRAKGTLEGLHGNVVKGGGLNKKLAGMTGALIGHSLGVPIIGDLLGYKAGGMANDYMISPERKLGSTMQTLEKSGYKPSSQKTLEKANEDSGKFRAQQLARPAIEAPKKQIVNRSTGQTAPELPYQINLPQKSSGR